VGDYYSFLVVKYPEVNVYNLIAALCSDTYDVCVAVFRHQFRILSIVELKACYESCHWCY